MEPREASNRSAAAIASLSAPSGSRLPIMDTAVRRRSMGWESLGTRSKVSLSAAGKIPLRGEGFAIVLQLPGIGKLAAREQPGHLFESAVGGQILYGIAAVVQAFAFQTASANRGIARDDAGQSAGLPFGAFGHAMPCLSDFYRTLDRVSGSVSPPVYPPLFVLVFALL